MNKQIKYTNTGMNQDISNAKFNNQFYFEGMNIRVLSTNIQSSGAITNTKGNEFLLKIPIPIINKINKTISYNNNIINYNNSEIDLLENNNLDQIIIGNCKIKTGFVIFTTDNNGLDCIWLLEETSFDLKLLYIRNLGFNTKLPIQALNNYENDKINKIYWIDGKKQIKVINIYHSVLNNDAEELIDLSSSSLNSTADVNFSEIIIDDILYGGTHTSGMIQYAYSYYKINGSESAISPLSIIIPLGKSNIQGGNPNEIVGTIPKIIINNLDNRFTNLKLYAIKYTSLNVIPSINVIADRDIRNLNSLTYYDDGSTLYSSSLEDIVFGFSNIIIPKHIETKNNRLFAFNFENKTYTLNLKNNNLDTRAYSFPINSQNTIVYNSITAYNDTTNTVEGTFTPVTYNNNILNSNFLEFNHPCINGNYNINKYIPNTNKLGGEGYYLKYELIRTTENKNNIYDFRFFKDNELYRLGIQFYNKFGIKSTPNWIADFVVTSDDSSKNNLSGFYAGIKLTLKPEFYVWLNTSSNFLDSNGVYDEFLKPIGFKLIRGERTNNDKTILDQGFLNGMLACNSAYEPSSIDVYAERCNSVPKIPSLIRRFDDKLAPMFANQTYRRLDLDPHPYCNLDGSGTPNSEAYAPNLDPRVDGSGDRDRSQKSSIFQFNKLMNFYSPEILFEINNNFDINKLRIVGAIENNYNALKMSVENWNTAEFSSYENYPNVISPYDIASSVPRVYHYNYDGGMRYGLFGPSFINDANERKRVYTYQFYRKYTGGFTKNDNDLIYEIYGKPQIVDYKSNVITYNNDNDLQYLNSLNLLNTNEAGHDDRSKTDSVKIDSVIVDGCRTSIFALGDETVETKNRKALEDLFNESEFNFSLTSNIIYSNQRNNLLTVVNKITDLALLDFSKQYVGVIEDGSVYFNNDIITPVYNFNSELINEVFFDLTDYNTKALSGLYNYNGFRIAFTDGINTDVYEVLDTSLGVLPGGLSLLNNVNFLYCKELELNEVNLYVNTLQELYNLNTSIIRDHYKVGVKNNNKIYEFLNNSINNSETKWHYLYDIPSSNITESDNKGVILIAEYIKDESLKYIGNYYGGNSYEAKKNTVYVEASKYFILGNITNSYIINDPGDVYVQNYKITRLGKQNAAPSSSSLLRFTEIVEIKLESSINNNKRNDLSKNDIIDVWQPSQQDYHVYNRVYSQQSSILKSQDFSYQVKQNNLFDASIITSNLKQPNEIKDNWTIFAPNNTMNLEGKYGSINAVVKHNDEIFTFQDSAIAQISINPRVQIQGSDGISIKLGTGNLLDKYTYINTNTGTLNKWGVISTNSGIYYYDTINNSLNTISQNGKLSDLKQLHSFFQKNINNDIIKKDNHILKEGIQFGYDYLNNDIYFTFLQSNNSITINFNELQNEFVSLHSFKPSFYFNKGEIFITSDPSNNKLYNHLEGIYNIYYDEYNPSYVIYNLNPEPDVECVFDNINFKSEAYINNIDQPLTTINGIQCYNDYQDSTLIPLIEGRNSNLRRKFRDWNAIIPRQGRNRIRGPYSKLKLQFDNDNNCKLILHDIVLSYTM
jgi:hypothetical protein